MFLLRNLTCLLLIVCIQTSCTHQNEDARFEKAIDSFRKHEIRGVDTLLQVRKSLSRSDSLIYSALQWKFNHLDKGLVDGFPKEGLDFFRTKISKNSAIFQLYYGDYLFYSGIEEKIAYHYYSSSLEIAERYNEPLLICEAKKRMVDLVNDKGTDSESMETLSKQYTEIAFDSFEEDLSNFQRIRAKALQSLNPSIDSVAVYPFVKAFIAGKERSEKNGNQFVVAQYSRLLGVIHFVFASQLAKEEMSYDNYGRSTSYYNDCLDIYNKYETADFASRLKAGIYLNKGNVFNITGQLDSASRNWHKASNLLPPDSVFFPKHDSIIPSPVNQLWQDKTNFHRGLATYLELSGMADSAFYHKSREIDFVESNNRKRIDFSVAEINTLYETKKKEKRIQQATILIVILIVGMVLTIVLLLFYRSRQRMMKMVAAKNEEIFNQEVNQLLSEQELKSINSMIEGQEKERKRVAEDLHDRLGSTLTAAKMHVDVISSQNVQFEKVSSLLDQALTDTREISHNMLSGVLTNFGLVAALKDLVETVAGTNRIRINLEYEELDKRLESQTEINVYRILQELISNTLKHSKAQTVNISFKKANNDLLIKYSDDGIGFDFKQKKSNGIGFKNIAARVGKIGGEWEYSSKFGEGFQAELSISLD